MPAVYHLRPPNPAGDQLIPAYDGGTECQTEIQKVSKRELDASG